MKPWVRDLLCRMQLPDYPRLDRDGELDPAAKEGELSQTLHAERDFAPGRVYVEIPTRRETETVAVGDRFSVKETTNYRVVTEDELLALHRQSLQGRGVLVAVGLGGFIVGFLACCAYIGVL